MNVKKIQELSKQCCALEIFKDRCTWNEANFAVREYLLDDAASARIKTGIRAVVEAAIEKLQAEIIKVVEAEIKPLRFSDGS